MLLKRLLSRFAIRNDSNSSSDLDLILSRLVPDPEDFSIESWTSRLERSENCAIQFVPFALPPGFFGARIILEEETRNAKGVLFPTAEYLFYADWLNPAHAEHVKAHELAHVALGHPTLILSLAEFEARRASLLSELLQGGFCCRASEPVIAATGVQERDQEAERLTRIIYQRVLAARQRRSLARHSSQQNVDVELHRLGID